MAQLNVVLKMTDVDQFNPAMIDQLLATAFPRSTPVVTRMTDAGAGRGVFSNVLQLSLSWPERPYATPEQPDSVVAKLPLGGPNGQAAAASGAYGREASVYRSVLGQSPIATPRVFAVTEPSPNHFALLLEDLTPLRSPDQLVGLSEPDALMIADSLGRFHRHWADRQSQLDRLQLRRQVLANINGGSVRSGLQQLRHRWSQHLDPGTLVAYEQLAASADDLADVVGPETLCHGDPRADNMAFNPSGEPILFDWQQVAVQPGEYDLAWLAATSLTTEVRRRSERDMVTAYNGHFDRYRAGFVIPGLMVLLLIQRQLPTPRLEKLATISLQRIGCALVDLDVVQSQPLGR